MISSSIADANLALRDDIVIRTFQPEASGEGFSGTLAIHPNLTSDYFKNEVGIDVEKLARHPELFSANPSGHYTFPKGSGTVGTLTWKLPAQDGNSSIAAYEHMTCVDCIAICASTALIPLGWIACRKLFLLLISSTPRHF
ncbi:hypothetical protein ABKA04_003776 [Annulohypoxylon sp. FPYF3050]